MRSRNVLITLALLVLLYAVFITRTRQEPRAKEIFNREPARLEYTRHALCRMDCRQISREEIREIMKKGVINLNRSNKKDKPCPSYALQGRTSSGENLRVIFAQCGDDTKVITCYNLEKDFACDCPGDNNKTNN